MEENLIIKSRRDRKTTNIFLFLGLALLVVSVAFMIWAFCAEYRSVPNPNGISHYSYSFFDVSPITALSITILFLGSTAYSLLMYFAIRNSEIIVKQDSVYGRTVFDKRVDLPVDSISAVGTSMFKGIAVSSSSGIIKFYAIENAYDIKNAISNLLKERQQKNSIGNGTTNITQQVPQSNADELKKYKELLDSGIITQEEFDAKKKQLLGL